MMKFFRNNLKLAIGFIIGVILASSITVYAYNYLASDIKYTDEKSVEDALNELYSKSKINKKLSELKAGTNNNSSKTIYVALIGVTSASGASNIVNSRTQIKNIIGADAQEVFYSFESESNVRH